MPKKADKDFIIYAEFWAATDTNRGVFIWAADPQKISVDSFFEVNIQENRPDPHHSAGAGADEHFAKVTVPLVNKTGGRWNAIDVTEIGQTMTVQVSVMPIVGLSNGEQSQPSPDTSAVRNSGCRCMPHMGLGHWF